jgi:hypothetical protein
MPPEGAAGFDHLRAGQNRSAGGQPKHVLLAAQDHRAEINTAC